MPHSSHLTQLSRRSFARGAAWSVPAVSVVAAAPALAASPVPSLSSWTYFGQANVGGSTVSSYSCNGMMQFEVDAVRSPGAFTITNVHAGAKITGITTTFWLATTRGTTWRAASNSSSCWTVPTATGASTTMGGVTFSAFSSTYTCAATASGSTFSLGASNLFHFVSSCQSVSSSSTGTYHYTQTASVDGVALKPKDNGWGNVMS